MTAAPASACGDVAHQVTEPGVPAPFSTDDASTLEHMGSVCLSSFHDWQVPHKLKEVKACRWSAWNFEMVISAAMLLQTAAGEHAWQEWQAASAECQNAARANQWSASAPSGFRPLKSLSGPHTCKAFPAGLPVGGFSKRDHELCRDHCHFHAEHFHAQPLHPVNCSLTFP